MINKNNIIAVASMTLTLAFILLGIFFTDGLNNVFSAILKVTSEDFGWFYLIAAFLFLVLCVYLMFSKYGNIKLGKDTDKPEYSTKSWLAMLFSAAMGCGLVFWGVAEPVMHYITPPMGKGGTAEAADTSMKFVFFHWGFNAWAIYAVVALGLAYFQFRKNLPGLISSIFYPVLKDRIYGPLGKSIDIYSTFMTAIGVSTVLGVTTLQLAGGLNTVWGVPNTLTFQIILLSIVTVLFMVSAYSGLNRGVKILSNLNMIIAFSLMILIFILGPSSQIMRIFTNATGEYLRDIIPMSLRLQTFSTDTWIVAWTIFYWAWWSTWAPFVGTFIARISKGRTIREFLIGVLIIPTLINFMWFSVLGGSALHFVHDLKQTALAEAINNDTTIALFSFLGNFPFSSVLSFIAILLISSFFITSADSATYVLGMYSGNGTLNPSNKLKMVWGLFISGSAIVLLISGGVSAVQTVSIAIAFPFYILMVIMCYSILKAVTKEKAHSAHEFRSSVINNIGHTKQEMSKAE
ncbi:BCCT family transporter [Neobacillus mesonae]|uniref:glycine betaine uptake BCCT transporter n=1 Tax=Neobacillus mesonae TaxID=1193713 RepID=UPI00203F4FE8|nr:BCCT family transporter [Neobacillus mesonae]MCM3569023.1 BCCT family transporter [Neobacillus mesonae]